MGGTTAWKVAGIDPSTTLYYILPTFIRTKTCPSHYYSSTVRKIIFNPTQIVIFNPLNGSNSSSLSSWADASTNINHISASFDQEAAAAVMARLAVHRSVRTNQLTSF